MNGDNVIYFDRFGVEHIPQKTKKNIVNRNITTIIYRIQVNDSIMYGYFYIGFFNFMLKGKRLLDYTKLFSRNKYEKNDNIILECLNNAKLILL